MKSNDFSNVFSPPSTSSKKADTYLSKNIWLYYFIMKTLLLILDGFLKVLTNYFINLVYTMGDGDHPKGKPIQI